jgi:hypothetical protein
VLTDLKNHSSSAEFEPKNLGSNGKHDNHLTTEGEKIINKILTMLILLDIISNDHMVPVFESGVL